MSYDDVLTRIAGNGQINIRILLVLCLPMISCTFNELGGVFLSAKTEFRCLLPNESQENATFQISPDFFNTTYPGNGQQCEKYNPSISITSETASENSSSGLKCDSFVYDKAQYATTTVTEWNLVCDSAWMRSLIDSLFMLADVPGVLVWGALSDKYGRRTALVWASSTQMICGALVAVSLNSASYAIFRAIIGSTINGLSSVVNVTAIELASPKYRTRAGNIVYTGLAVGNMLTAGLAYCIRKWRILQIAFTVPSLLLLALSWSIPESARWLLTKGRVQEAINILEKESSKNGGKLSQDVLDGLLDNIADSETSIQQRSLLDLVRYPNLRKRSLALFLIWFFIGITYFGLSLNTSNLGGNDYVNFFIIAAVELPASLFAAITLNRWGRKVVICGCLFLSGSSLFSICFVPMDVTLPVKLLAMVGKCAITCAFGATIIFTTELYPTEIRNIGFAACSAFIKMAAASTLYLDYLFQISTFLPFAILGSSAIIAGLLLLLLPETRNAKLPEKIGNIEVFAKRRSKNNKYIEESNTADAWTSLNGKENV